MSFQTKTFALQHQFSLPMSKYKGTQDIHSIFVDAVMALLHHLRGMANVQVPVTVVGRQNRNRSMHVVTHVETKCLRNSDRVAVKKWALVLTLMKSDLEDMTTVFQ